MFPLCDVQVTELMICIFCERNTHAWWKMKIIYIEVFGLIFFSEYLNDCFHFEGNAHETCQLTVVWFPPEFPVTTQKLHEFKSEWTKVYSLSHLSLVKFKHALYGHQQLLNNKTLEWNYNKTGTPKLILHCNLC